MVVTCICFKAMALCIQEGRGTIVCASITHIALFIYFISQLCTVTHGPSLFPSHRRLLVIFQYYCGKPFLMGKESKSFIFFTPKPHSQSVLKLSLGYRSSYIAQSVLPVNEMSLSFYTEIILKLRCKILCKNDVFESVHKFKRKR